jgi:hypothetical protein
MNIFRSTLFLAISLGVVGAAFAGGSGFDISTGRDYAVTAKTGTLTGVALGNGGGAELNVGGIQVQNTSIGLARDYRTNIQTGSVTAVSLGRIGTGPVNLGGIQSMH